MRNVSAAKESEESAAQVPDRRKDRRWDSVVSLKIIHPANSRDLIDVTVRDLSSGGLRIAGQFPSALFSVGLKLQALLELKDGHYTEIALQVQWINDLEVGMSFLETNDRLKKILGQHIFESGLAASIQQIRDSNLKVSTARGMITFGWVSNEFDYDSVLSLRAKSYHWVAGNDMARKNALRDALDKTSKIFLAKYKSQTVGSFRFISPSESDIYSHSKFVDIPLDFPPSHKAIEISRLCTDQDFRGADLFYLLVNEIIIAALSHNRPWVVSSCQENLIPLYRKMGAKIAVEKFDIPDHNVKNVYLIAFNVVDMLSAKNVDLFFWKAYLRECLIRALDSGLIELSFWDKLRVKALNFCLSLILKSKAEK